MPVLTACSVPTLPNSPTAGQPRHRSPQASAPRPHQQPTTTSTGGPTCAPIRRGPPLAPRGHDRALTLVRSHRSRSTSLRAAASEAVARQRPPPTKENHPPASNTHRREPANSTRRPSVTHKMNLRLACLNPRATALSSGSCMSRTPTCSCRQAAQYGRSRSPPLALPIGSPALRHRLNAGGRDAQPTACAADRDLDRESKARPGAGPVRTHGRAQRAWSRSLTRKSGSANRARLDRDRPEGGRGGLDPGDAREQPVIHGSP